MTAANHRLAAPMSGKVAVGALGAITGFDVVASVILLSGHGNQLAAMGVVAGSVLAIATTVSLYCADRVDGGEVPSGD